MTQQTLLCDGWRFVELPPGSSLGDAMAAQSQMVDLPHDFLIWDASALYRDADGWYLREVVPAPLPRRSILRFDGVYMDVSVYVNGNHLMDWKNGYTAFEADITELADGQPCSIALVCRHLGPNSRWYSGAGIYRDVHFISAPGDGIKRDGLYAVSRHIQDDAWQMEVSCDHLAGEGALVKYSLEDPQGRLVFQGEPGKERQTLFLPGILPWSPDSPSLYTLTAQLFREGKLLDQAQINTGFRSLRLDPARGLFLNGQPFKVHGACQHHDLGALGAAFNASAARRQLETLRGMGVNAIRTAHNPAADAFLDLCDSMGFLVMSEFTDIWEQPKTRYDYARFFKDWHEIDVKSWVQRDRKHVSVVFWSIGNEIGELRSERGLEITRDLKKLVRQHDPLGQGLLTMGSNYMQFEWAQRCMEEMDLVGYNYAERLYQEHKARYPHWNIYGSETSSALQSRGIYHFPLSQNILADDDLQCSSLDNCGASWGAKSAQRCILDDRDATFSLGMFIWTGTDYIGEPTPYHTRNSYFGQVDTAGFPKDAYHLYRASWRQEPMVHLLPHWDWNEGQLIDVRVASNLSRIRLSLGGKTIGEQSLDVRSGQRLYADWQVPFSPGTLLAEAFDQQGRLVASHSRSTPGEAVRIIAKPSKPALLADGWDLVFVEISLADSQGNPVDNANNRVQVQVQGQARLVGLDNGDSADPDPYKTDNRRLFSGKLLAMVQSGLGAGQASLHISGEGLLPAALQLDVQPPQVAVQGISAVDAIPPGTPVQDIPIRTIKITADGQRLLTPENPSLSFTALALPVGNTHPQLSWRAANAAGIDPGHLVLEADGNTCRVSARGDGQAFIRCSANNGAAHPQVISVIELSAQGFGQMMLNPYRFIQAGRYTLQEGELASGNDRGVSIPPNAQGVFGFENLDFGRSGSNIITIPVFALQDGPITLSLYEGLPAQGGRKIHDLVYQKKMIWNTYQAQTWTLPEHLRGIKTLSLGSKNRIHVQGFIFEEADRAFSRHSASSRDILLGDSYQQMGDWVRGIGNNVVLRYLDMEFHQPAPSLSIAGSSRGDLPVELLFNREDGSTLRQTLLFPNSPGEVEKTFALRPLLGRGSLDFVFLPGADFDFHYFQFHQEGKAP